jgi:hypothetical protein
MADDTRPLRALGPDDPQPPVDPLQLRPLRELGPKEFFELVARRCGLGPGTGEQTVEIRFENGRFAWCKIHTGRLGLDHFDQGDSAA